MVLAPGLSATEEGRLVMQPNQNPWPNAPTPAGWAPQEYRQEPEPPANDLDELAAAGPGASYLSYRRRRPRQQAGPAIVAVILMFGVFVWFVVSMVGASKRDQVRNAEQAVQEKRQKAIDNVGAERIQAALDKAVKDGAIYRVEYDRRIMRVEPLVWVSLPLETKERVTDLFYLYYKLRGQEASVKVMSSRNDTILSEVSVWSGREVHY